MTGFIPTMSVSYSSPPSNPLHTIKICGLTSVADASLTLSLFQDVVSKRSLSPHLHLPELILGMVLWQKSRRSVNMDVARGIGHIARGNDVRAVGVFVDEDAIEIKRVLRDTGLHVAQLHGVGARRGERKLMETGEVDIVRVVNVGKDGMWADDNDIWSQQDHEGCWRLFDSGKGSGKCFDWSNFEKPKGKWALAGGLNPENVGDAIRWLGPWGVDVSSGVTAGDGCRKDKEKLKLFLENALDAAWEVR